MALLHPVMPGAPVARPDCGRVLAEALGPKAALVLDVSCGHGSLARLLVRLGHWVTGVERSGRRVGRLRAEAERCDWPAEFLAGEPSRLPVPPESFDAVVARHLLSRLAEPHSALAEWLRVLRPGGRLVLIDSYPAARRGWLAPGSVLRAPPFPVQKGAPFGDGLRPNEARLLAALADVKDLSYYEIGKPHYLVAGRKP